MISLYCWQAPTIASRAETSLIEQQEEQVKPTCVTYKGVQDPDFRSRVWQVSAHFEQTGSDPDYGFIQVSGSGSGFSNFSVLGFDANTNIK